MLKRSKSRLSYVIITVYLLPLGSCGYNQTYYLVKKHWYEATNAEFALR